MQTADRVRQILRSRGLTLYQVSQRSAEIFGQLSPYFIPEGLYHELATRTVSPNIHQLAAFSHITNYRLCDWLTAFGFRLDDIPKLQLLNQSPRTVLLDSSVYDGRQWIPWFVERMPQSTFPDIIPLGQMLQPGPAKRAGELLAFNKSRFVYAQIGREDVFAFPSLAPGSIARIDARQTRPELSALGSDTSKRIFLVEDGPFLNCGHLKRIDKGRLLLCSSDFPFSHIELTLGSSVRILGVVNAEIRPLAERSDFTQPPARVLRRTASATTDRARVGLQQLLRSSRIRAGLSFREASLMSHLIAQSLKDRTYFAAAGTLSDYENASSPLRHIQKIFSLCAVYCIGFWVFLRAAGVRTDLLGNDAMSDGLVARAGPPTVQHSDDAAFAGHHGKIEEGFLSTLINRWEECPLFMRTALPFISKLKDFSLSDVFWVGGNRQPTHPSLVGAELVAINRRIKTPQRTTAPTAWQQPLYLVLKRDGSYFCASCELRRDILVIHPHSDKPHTSVQFRNGIDAEVVGQVTAIARNII